MRVKDQDGRRLIWGNNELKGSQAYPVPFGQAIANVWGDHEIELLEEAAVNLQNFAGAFEDIVADDLFGPLPTLEEWRDAELDDVFRVLQSRDA